MKVNTNPIRGTYDYAPRDAELRENVRQIILNCYQNNGFSLINTPILESLDLLNSSEGGDNLRLMFKTIKRGEKLNLSKPDLTEKDITEEGLRYDLTVPLARFYANNREKLPIPFKAIQIDYSFRAERPQRGRDRQFIQCDIDEFGDDSVQAEIDVLTTGLSAYIKLGFENLNVKVNSRQILNAIVLYAGYSKEQISTICVTLDKFDKIGIVGVRAELIEKEKEFVSQDLNALSIDENNQEYTRVEKLCSALNKISNEGTKSLKEFGVSADDIERVERLVSAVNKFFETNNVAEYYKCEFNVSIVRGQGYYTGVVYEVYTEGFGGAIGAGGRYDKMITKLIGIDVPAVGFSIGFAPVCMLLSEQNKKFGKNKKIALIYDNEPFERVLEIKTELMQEYNVSVYKRPKNLKALLDKLSFANFDGFAFIKDNINDIEIKNI